MTVVAGIDTTDNIALTYITCKTLLVADSLPRLDTNKWATFLVRCPYTISICVNAVNSKHWIALLVA